MGVYHVVQLASHTTVFRTRLHCSVFCNLPSYIVEMLVIIDMQFQCRIAIGEQLRQSRRTKPRKIRQRIRLFSARVERLARRRSDLHSSARGVRACDAANQGAFDVVMFSECATFK